MKIILLMIISGLMLPVVSAQEINRRVADQDAEKEILIGKSTREGLLNAPFKDWFNDGYQTYLPDENTISELRKRKKDVTVSVVMATWCSDTREHLPHFFKIIDAAKINDKHIDMIAVDRSRSAGDIDISALGITRVPTFIFKKKGVELGRIVESPTLSIEKDMLLILMQGD
jgi:thiol-disulfide isomerase/thioredoxin